MIDLNCRDGVCVRGVEAHQVEKAEGKTAWDEGLYGAAWLDSIHCGSETRWAAKQPKP
jgi:hypothetical protein